MTDERATIAICTHRHEPDLVATLESLGVDLGAQEPPPVIVVRSETREDEPLPHHISSPVAELPFPVRFVCEPQPGVAAARARALVTADTEAVLFVDDDVYVVPGWFERMNEAMARTGVGAAGGTVLPRWPRRRPWWLPGRLESYYGHRESSPQAQHPPFGLNMGIRRSAAWEAGGFRPELGHAASTPGLHEETDLIVRIERSGYRVAEVPEAIVEHIVRPEQVTLRWVLRRAWHEGRSDAVRDRRAARHHIIIRMMKLLALVCLFVPSLVYPRAGVYVGVRILVNLSNLKTMMRGPDASA
jgi:GT2 family glycosyltransferase